MTDSSIPFLSTQPIRSFVIRQGRMSEAQRRYKEQMMPLVGIAFTHELLDFAQVFSRPAPVIVEIGCGMGDTTAKICLENPQYNYIGIEVHDPGIGNLCKLIQLNDIKNLRLIQHDAIEVLQHMIPYAALFGIHVFFPDPWPKKRHHKRRLIQPKTVQELSLRLQPQGYLHCATDWADYAEQMQAVLSSEPLLHNDTHTYLTRTNARPLTKFEQRGRRLGHEIQDLYFLKKRDHS